MRKPTSSAITLGDVSHLEDEVGHDAVDRGVLVVQCLLVINTESECKSNPEEQHQLLLHKFIHRSCN